MKSTTIWGNLNEIGVEVFIDGDMVVIADNNDRNELPDTQENREKLIAEAKKLIDE